MLGVIKVKTRKNSAVLLICVLLLGVLFGCTNKNISITDNLSLKANSKMTIYILCYDDEKGTYSFAQDKASKINDSSKYFAEVVLSKSAEEQLNEIDKIIETNDKSAVILYPVDETLVKGIERLAAANIPYVIFGREFQTEDDFLVSNVWIDAKSIGAATAAYFVEKGLNKGDNIYIFEKDDTAETGEMRSGFREYLSGELEYNSEKIPSDKQWSENDIKSIFYTGSLNNEREESKFAFESIMDISKNTSLRWFFVQDDNMTMGILEALSATGISDSAKSAFLKNSPVISGCGGISEMFDVLRGDMFSEITNDLGGLMSVYSSQFYIEYAVDDMIDYLNGEEVEKKRKIECSIVTKENVTQFVSF